MRPSSCSPSALTKMTGSRDSTWVRTTTSPSRSAHASFPAGSGQCCVALNSRDRPEDQIIRIDDRLQVDLQRRQVIVDDERVGLRPTEYRLLYHLIQNAGWVVPHETLLTKVWGHEYVNDNHLLRLYITYLRQKIEPDPSHPRYIFTERGLGYRFVDYEHEFGSEPADREQIGVIDICIVPADFDLLWLNVVKLSLGAQSAPSKSIRHVS